MAARVEGSSWLSPLSMRIVPVWMYLQSICCACASVRAVCFCECESQERHIWNIYRQSALLFSSAGLVLAARVEGWAQFCYVSPVSTCTIPFALGWVSCACVLVSPLCINPSVNVNHKRHVSTINLPFYFRLLVISWRRVLRAGLTLLGVASLHLYLPRVIMHHKATSIKLVSPIHHSISVRRWFPGGACWGLGSPWGRPALRLLGSSSLRSDLCCMWTEWCALAFARCCCTLKLYCGSQSSFYGFPPTAKPTLAYPDAILLHDHCPIYAPPPTLLLYAIHH